MKNIYTILILILLASPVSAEMYEWVDEHGIRHFSNIPSVIEVQNVTVKTEIKSAATPQQRVEDRQPSDDSSDIDTEIMERRKRVRQTAAIEKAEKLVEELTQSTDLAAIKFQRANRKRRRRYRKNALYRKYIYEREKLEKAQAELNRLKNGSG